MLQKILGDESLNLEKLEQYSGEPGVDVRLTSDIAAKLRMVKKHLGLDPDDTTDAELYGAVQAIAELHDEFVAKHLERISLVDILKKTGALDQEVWAVKHPTIRRIIVQNPPDKVMSKLGFRSVDSMARRANMSEVMILANQLETKRWHQKTQTQLKKLTSQDFEERKIFAIDSGGAALAFEILAGVIVLPDTTNNVFSRKGAKFSLLMSSLEAIDLLREESSYLKMHQMDKDFGKIVADTEATDRLQSELAGHELGWRHIRRHLGERTDYNEIINPKDFKYQKPTKFLAKLEPALDFWNGLEYVGQHSDSGIISLNVMDALHNLFHENDFWSRAAQNLTSHLRDELLYQYSFQPAFSSDIMP